MLHSAGDILFDPISLYNFVRLCDSRCPIMVLLDSSEYPWMNVKEVIKNHSDWFMYSISHISIGNDCIDVIIDK